MIRRQFLQASYGLGLSAALSACGTSHAVPSGRGNGGSLANPAPANGTASTIWHMPDEAEPHQATWMGFAARRAIWGQRLMGPVQDTLALIANTIVQYEAVNMLVNPGDMALARRKLDPRVKLVPAKLDDLWLRDTGPVYVKNSRGELAGVNFNFNGWGNRQQYARDATVAKTILDHTGHKLISSSLVLEGGGIEVDGQGSAIITESCVLNRNRNPGVSKQAAEAELKRVLGIRKVIWLPGIKGRDITDAHTDFYARFVRPGVVVAALEHDPDSYEYALTRRHLDILRSSRDANNLPLKVLVLNAPEQVRPRYDSDEFAAGYINYYVCNRAVIMPEFGDPHADQEAQHTLQQAFPGRRIIALNIDPLAAGGGGIHCTTQQQPA